MLRRLTYVFLSVLSFSSLLHAQGGTKELDSVTVNGDRIALSRETNVAVTKVVFMRRLAISVS